MNKRHYKKFKKNLYCKTHKRKIEEMRDTISRACNCNYNQFIFSTPIFVPRSVSKYLVWRDRGNLNDLED